MLDDDGSNLLKAEGVNTKGKLRILHDRTKFVTALDSQQILQAGIAVAVKRLAGVPANWRTSYLRLSGLHLQTDARAKLVTVE